MYLRVADGAGLVLVRLIVERRYPRSGEVHRSRMALQAQRVDIIAGQQPRVWRSVWVVARCAALGLDHRMRVDERAGRLGMALRAYYVAAGAGVQHRGGFLQGAFERAVRIVAIAAGHQTFIHFVMKGLSERRLDVGVAAIAELWLRHFEKALFAFRLMDTVAAGAANLSLTVRRVRKIRMRISMAAEAFIIHRFGRRLAELEDLGCISAGIDVCLAGPVAVFAGDALATVHQGHASVRVVRELFCFSLMAGFAGFGACVAGGECRMIGRRNGSLLPAIAASLHLPCFPEHWHHQEKRRTEKNTSHRDPLEKH